MTSITEARLLAIIRYREAGDLDGAVAALASGGIDLLEITIDTPGALDAVERAVSAGRTMGVGTVLSVDQVRAAAGAGASFVVSPCLARGVVETARELGMEAIPGALTPTEIRDAEQSGATAVKLFPASLGGPGYVSALRGPFPITPLVVTGGLRLDDIEGFLFAGANCIGLGSDLVGPSPPVGPGELTRLTERAARAVGLAGG